MKVIGNPVKFTGEPENPEDFTYPPRLGENTSEVLLSLGYEQDRITDLLRQGTVIEARPRAEAASQ